MSKVKFIALFLLLLSSTAFAGPIFTDISDRIGYSGVSVIGDVNGDGRPDLVSGRRVWLNMGLGVDGKPIFQSVIQGLDFTSAALSHMILVDIDGDGDKDLVAAQAFGDVRLYRNDSCGNDLRFVDITQQVGLGGNIAHEQTHLALEDIDGDGDLDIYATEGWPSGLKGVLYRNDSDEHGIRFTQVTAASGIVAPPACRAILFNDFDGDGKPDLYLASHTGAAKLYLNKGDLNGDRVPEFVDVTVRAGVSFLARGNGATAGDFDNDGRMDIIEATGTNLDYQPLKVFRNMGDTNGDGVVDFVDIGTHVGVPAAVHHGVGLGDINNDGYLDLALANFYDSPLEIFGNTGHGSFTTITTDSGIGSRLWGVKTLFADLDNDGDLDLWMNGLFLNNTNNAAFLKVELLGSGLNRDAIGAKLRVWPAGKPHTNDNLAANREITAGTAFFSSDDAVLEMGLAPGDYDLEATFRSGVIKSMTGVHTGQSTRIMETPLVFIPKRCGNKPPKADAGPDKTVECLSGVHLDASGSSDPEGDPLIYRWKEGEAVLGTGKMLDVTLPFGEHTITLTVEDDNGGVGQDDITVTVQDTAPPLSVIADLQGMFGNDGWYRSAVVAALTASDTCSGVEDIRWILDKGATTVVLGDAVPVSISQDGVHSLSFLAKDHAGNLELVPNSATVKLDRTPPVITPTSTPGPNQYGWHNTRVVVSFQCFDAVSGIVACTEPIALTAEGAGQVVTGKAVDAAGNDTVISVSENIDITKPLISATVSPQPNLSGWHNSNVTVTFACSDTLSGIASCPEPMTVSTEGAGQVVTGTAVDRAGNISVASVILNIDKTPPVAEVSVPGTLWPPNHKLVKISPVVIAADALGQQVTVKLLSVQSSEPDNGLGDGDTANDIVVNADGTIFLRAERSGTGVGRNYNLNYLITDQAGNSISVSGVVTVPHNQ